MGRQMPEKKLAGILFGTHTERFLNRWRNGCANLAVQGMETFCLERGIVTHCESTSESFRIATNDTAVF